MMAESIKSLQNLINTHYNLAHTKLKSSRYAPFQSPNEMISTTLNIFIAYWKIIRLFRRFMYIVHNPPHHTTPNFKFIYTLIEHPTIHFFQANYWISFEMIE